MVFRKTALERAFELARSGKCFSLSDIIKQLKMEKYDAASIDGGQLIEEAKR